MMSVAATKRSGQVIGFVVAAIASLASVYRRHPDMRRLWVKPMKVDAHSRNARSAVFSREFSDMANKHPNDPSLLVSWSNSLGAVVRIERC